MKERKKKNGLNSERLSLSSWISEVVSSISEACQNLCSKKGASVKDQNRMADSIDPDETVHY